MLDMSGSKKNINGIINENRQKNIPKRETQKDLIEKSWFKIIC